jgi:pantoate--beta-alanine ligase
MRMVHTVSELRAVLAGLHRSGRLALVPTMGALHEGHMRLMRLARTEADAVAVSIFVNPAQFNDPADLSAYPRQEARDAAMAAEAGVDVLFVPPADEVYKPGHATSVVVTGAALGFEGDRRLGHFDGVALVCTKLFAMVQPHVAYFGQKDAQQVAVIRQVVRDLNLPLEIRVVPTVRDEHGLALSSRNARLSPTELVRAHAIPRALRAAMAAHRSGADPVAAARQALGDLTPEYLAIAVFDGVPTLVVAARVGGTRLIDNVPLDHPDLSGFTSRDVL